MNLGTAPAAAAPTETHAMDTVVDLAVRRYLDGKSDGSALFQALETQNIIDGQAAVTLIPKNSGLLGQLIATGQNKPVAK